MSDLSAAPAESPNRRKRVIQHFSDLEVYREAFRLGLHCFELSRTFPPEERYALTDQLRRAARSIGANISESWGKRRYEAHFISKLTDADAELHETEHWLACAYKHGYITDLQFQQERTVIAKIGGQIGKMMANPKPFLLKQPPSPSDL